MEKISGILPATSRVSTVDLQSSGSVRPGAPSYGRPIGSSPSQQQPSVVSHLKNDPVNEIEKISSDFFMLKPTIHKKIDEQIEQLPSFDQIEVKSPVEELEQKWLQESSKGSNIDLEA